MSGVLHRKCIEDVLRDRPAAKARGFMPFVRELLNHEDSIELLECVVTLRPDAWEWDADSRVLVAHEVTVTSGMTESKWDSYVALWWDLDAASVKLAVCEWDRYGHHATKDPCQVWESRLAPTLPTGYIREGAGK